MPLALLLVALTGCLAQAKTGMQKVAAISASGLEPFSRQRLPRSKKPLEFGARFDRHCHRSQKVQKVKKVTEIGTLQARDLKKCQKSAWNKQ